MSVRASVAWEPAVHFRFDALIRESCKPYGVDWLLVKAVAAAESLFDPGAPGGLMGLGRSDRPPGPYEPAENLAVGVKHLVRILRLFGDYRLALAAYNCGPGRVQQIQRKHGPAWRQVEPHLPEITRSYVPKVLRYRDEFVAYEAGKERQSCRNGCELGWRC